jgi:molybdopterin-guanine dinucleotide biosynthesis protein A
MGKDKALLEWRGQPAFQTQVAKLLSLHPAQTFVACRRAQGLESHYSLGEPVDWLYDPPGEDVGPIGAISRALETSGMPLLVLATDMPLISSQFLRDHILVNANPDRGFFLESDHGVQPLLGLYTPMMRPLLGAALSVGAYSVQAVVREAARQGLATVVAMPRDVEAAIQGANTPAEWAEQQRQAQ